MSEVQEKETETFKDGDITFTKDNELVEEEIDQNLPFIKETGDIKEGHFIRIETINAIHEFKIKKESKDPEKPEGEEHNVVLELKLAFDFFERNHSLVFGNLKLKQKDFERLYKLFDSVVFEAFMKSRKAFYKDIESKKTKGKKNEPEQLIIEGLEKEKHSQHFELPTTVIETEVFLEYYQEMKKIKFFIMDGYLRFDKSKKSTGFNKETLLYVSENFNQIFNSIGRKLFNRDICFDKTELEEVLESEVA